MLCCSTLSPQVPAQTACLHQRLQSRHPFQGFMFYLEPLVYYMNPC